ncbi:bifunctional acetate--CoA ligase family protein/GNAT family N-acetyltransferase [Desulforhabdus amnigena]|uniref:bifunctional acetate--CoA ligase family protein/GNAT family N-acetyltransferase n=1 Tax=Desulforhabdus amnigena TaxID=40218 RepID=UPI0016921598|nr:bifunctional acetate--CoA ligase family protein/GNAT family N-acetyltransferase [Desulforhabdus amnigena]NLJ28427.1 bifunctional acetate--CoA ligase family protein/GNAT family N-acetyltransferase [Deltaproteobacteria bacterium]
MTIRNLDYFFRPASVALVGASKKKSSIGGVLTRNLWNSGFEGELYGVNPNYEVIDGIPLYPDIASLPKAPELAVIATPPDTVPGLVKELGARGTKAVVVITAGFGESGGAEGRKLKNAMLEGARPHLLRVLGPNCMGVMVPRTHLNVSFSNVQPLPGQIAFVAQSGAVQTVVLDWATARNIGFSHFVALGEMADVDFGDMLDYLANDPYARAILLYMESVTQPRKFMSAARAAARMKPVIVLKAGRHMEGARAAASHTGALVGDDAVYDAAFRRAGMLRVYDLQELFSAVETLATLPPIRGDRLAILTNGGGIGVLATDSLMDEGGKLAEFSAETMDRLNAQLPSIWSHDNPVDMIGDASGERYAAALEAMFNDPGVDATLVLNCPNAMVDSAEVAQAVIDTYQKKTAKGVRPVLLTSWVGGTSLDAGRHLLIENRIPTYDVPSDAVRAFMQMVRYQRNQALLMETPPNLPEIFKPDVECARGVIEKALAEGREWLMETEAKEVLSAYRIPVVSTYFAEDPEKSAVAATNLGQPVVLKILSPDILHKTRVGGVVLDLQSPELVRRAAEVMLERVREAIPDARIRGFAVEPMIRRLHAHELIIGMTEDTLFGPVILFGHGGTAAEVIRDKAISLPPLNMHLARELMTRTRIFHLLEGNENLPHADLDGIAFTLVKVSQLVCDLENIVELDINPLLADEKDVLALDARIRVVRRGTSAKDRLSICPYPKELEEHITLPDGQTLFIRPIRPEDEPGLHRIFQHLSPNEIRLRFLHPMQILPHSLAARLTQIDYDREMALVVGGGSTEEGMELYGGVRIVADPDNENAEFSILLRQDKTGLGLGPMLLRRIIEYARLRHIGEIYGEVLAENKAMLKLCEAFGFKVKRIPDDPGVVHVSLRLFESATDSYP